MHQIKRFHVCFADNMFHQRGATSSLDEERCDERTPRTHATHTHNRGSRRNLPPHVCRGRRTFIGTSDTFLFSHPMRSISLKAVQLPALRPSLSLSPSLSPSLSLSLVRPHLNLCLISIPFLLSFPSSIFVCLLADGASRESE